MTYFEPTDLTVYEDQPLEKVILRVVQYVITKLQEYILATFQIIIWKVKFWYFEEEKQTWRRIFL